MTELAEQAVIDFFTYPPVGQEDWRYTYATAVVRSLETQMLSRGTLVDMANAEDFGAAVDLLSSSEYAAGGKEFEETLRQRRSEARALFSDLIIDKPIVDLLRTKEDFANMRLALRRKLTDKPIGVDYSDDGNVPAEQFEQIFEEENYGHFPYHIQEAIERAVLAYYQDRDIRQIDYELDAAHAEYGVRRAKELKNIFLLGLFRINIDLTNIRTMVRLKFAESEQRTVFLEGGYVEPDRFKHGLDIGYEALAPLFFPTPYYGIVEPGVAYLLSDKSFLKLERYCEEYLMGFLRATVQITAGPQPVITYLGMKEHEIRMVRLILTGKKNNLDVKLILDRLGE